MNDEALRALDDEFRLSRSRARNGITNDALLLKDPVSSAPAIIAPSYGVAVSYRSLAEQVENLASQLLGAGFKAGDVVAIVLPNGLEFLLVFSADTRPIGGSAGQSGRKVCRDAIFYWRRAG
jgi:hypothetical protein